jgi:hypothetical protein
VRALKMLRKVERLRFIHRGRVYDLTCIFNNMEFDCVPTYMCKNIDDVLVLDIENQLIAVVPERYIGNESEYTFKLWYGILKKFYSIKGGKGMQIIGFCDLTLAVWYGFGKMTDIISKSNDTKENKKRRIEYLDNAFKNRKNLRVPTKSYILSKLNYITVS